MSGGLGKQEPKYEKGNTGMLVVVDREAAVITGQWKLWQCDKVPTGRPRPETENYCPRKKRATIRKELKKKHGKGGVKEKGERWGGENRQCAMK